MKWCHTKNGNRHLSDQCVHVCACVRARESTLYITYPKIPQQLLPLLLLPWTPPGRATIQEFLQIPQFSNHFLFLLTPSHLREDTQFSGSLFLLGLPVPFAYFYVSFVVLQNSKCALLKNYLCTCIYLSTCRLYWSHLWYHNKYFVWCMHMWLIYAWRMVQCGDQVLLKSVLIYIAWDTSMEIVVSLLACLHSSLTVNTQVSAALCYLHWGLP